MARPAPRARVQASGVVILSPENWSDLPTNKHQLASRFQRIVPTLYVNAVGRSVVKTARMKVRGAEPVTLRQHPDGLWHLVPSVLPGRFARRSAFVRRLNRALVRRAVQKTVRRLHLSESVLFIYSPMFVGLLRKWRGITCIYHCVDHYASFPVTRPGARLERIAAERELLALVDIVITTSPALTQHCREVRDDVVEFVNAGDFELFHRAADVGSVANEVTDIARPILMFYGALSSYKVDLQLLELLANRRTEWSFVLIGPWGHPGDSERLFDRLRELPNVHWLGARRQGDLPRYLRAADVLLLPYVLTRHTRHVFPLKVFEYLATGKPIVATQLEALSEYSNAISIAVDADDFERLIAAAIERGAAGSSARVDLARRHTWASRVQSIRDLVLEREGVSIGGWMDAYPPNEVRPSGLSSTNEHGNANSS